MIDTKLILIDGLPGSGKSTTAQFIALQLERNHIPAKWFYELEQAHPIHAFHVWSREGSAKFVVLSKVEPENNYEDKLRLVLKFSCLFQRNILMQLKFWHNFKKVFAGQS